MNEVTDLNIQINNKINELLDPNIETVIIAEEFDIPTYVSKTITKHKKVLVLSGGGIKGIAHVGVLAAFEELGMLDKFETFAGASVGSIMIALIAVGYTPKEIYEFIIKFDLGKLRCMNVLGFLNSFGLDSGVRLEYIIKRLISSKGFDPEVTLGDLYDKTKKKIIFTTVCLNTKEVCYLSHETFPNIQLYKAVRMSISIPWFYTPVLYEDRLYIDGGCVDNYPIQLFADQISNVVGIYLVEHKDEIKEINDIETYTLRVLQCFMESITFNSKKGFEKYTIDVHMDAINIVDYGLNKTKKEELYKKGYDEVKSWYTFFK
jgi:predicted patatin/cPLA2 family phospholipase